MAALNAGAALYVKSDSCLDEVHGANFLSCHATSDCRFEVQPDVVQEVKIVTGRGSDDAVEDNPVVSMIKGTPCYAC